MKDNKNQSYPTEPAKVLTDAEIHQMFQELKYERWKQENVQRKAPWTEYSTVKDGGDY